MRKFRILSLGLFMLWMFPTGWAGAAFELERPGARPAGMGGAFCAVADDSDALWYNPAGLIQIPVPTLSFNYVRLLTGLDDGVLADNRLAYLQPLASWGTAGLAWYQRNLFNLYQENILALGYALPLAVEGHYVLGTTFKLLQQAYLDKDATQFNPYFRDKSSVVGWALDLGTWMNLTENISAGMSLANLNQPNMALSSATNSKLPAQLRVGGAYHFESFLTATEFLWTPYGFRGSWGGEGWWFDHLLGTRAGVAMNEQGLAEVTAGLSLCLPLVLWSAQIDYAYLYPLGAFSGAGGTHQMNLTFYFGKNYFNPDEARARMLIDAGEKARQAGKLDEALESWEAAKEYQPNNEVLISKIENLKEEIQKTSEGKLHLKQGHLFALQGQYFNAALEYRKVLALKPDNLEAASALKQVEANIQQMTKMQKTQQEQKEKQAALEAQQQSQKQANQAWQKAMSTYEKMEREPRVRSFLENELKRVRQQLESAQSSLRNGDNERVLAVTQALMDEMNLFTQKAIQREKAAASRRAEADGPAAAAPSTVETPKTSSEESSETPGRVRKKARGAYGRAVKLMLDIDRLNGPALFPTQYDSMKQELAHVKLLLKSEDYTTTIRYAEKLFPNLEKLKKACQEKENAQKALPTNW